MNGNGMAAQRKGFTVWWFRRLICTRRDEEGIIGVGVGGNRITIQNAIEYFYQENLRSCW
jgi:hypothetical protein